MLFVTDLLLGTDQPLLLVGEPGCGKSSFAETLLQPNYFYQRLGVTPALRAAHLRHVLHRKSLNATREKGLFPGGKPARAAALRGRCLFFVEDLHMVPLGEWRPRLPQGSPRGAGWRGCWGCVCECECDPPPVAVCCLPRLSGTQPLLPVP